MAQDMIKDFVKKQTTAISIGVPRQRPAQEAVVETPAAPVEEPAPAEKKTVRGVGRPSSGIEKVKISVYVPAEVKEKLVKIQHRNYKPSLNDVVIEAIADLINKNEL